MKRRLAGAVRRLLLAWLLVVLTSPVYGVGVGFHIEAGSGSGELTVEDGLCIFQCQDLDYDIDTTHLGTGFALDTSLTGDSVFNYRLTVGPEFIDVDEEDVFFFQSFPGGSTSGTVRGHDAELAGLTVTHDFGFRLWGNDRIRIWLGPEIRLGAYAGDNDVNHDIFIAAAGIGPVLGANFGVGDNLFIAPRLGYIWFSFIGEETNFSDEDLFGLNSQLSLSLALLWKL